MAGRFQFNLLLYMPPIRHQAQCYDISLEPIQISKSISRFTNSRPSDDFAMKPVYCKLFDLTMAKTLNAPYGIFSQSQKKAGQSVSHFRSKSVSITNKPKTLDVAIVKCRRLVAPDIPSTITTYSVAYLQSWFECYSPDCMPTSRRLIALASLNRRPRRNWL